MIKPAGKLILASASPRRKMLLEGLGLDFRVVVKEIEESCPGHVPVEELAECIAVRKSEQFDASDLTPDDILITADTIVVLNGRVIGKPEGREDAIAMLVKLSGRMHLVYTGVCIRSLQKKVQFTDLSKVWFAPLSEESISRYVDFHKPFDKAGGYGIQEWIAYAGVARVEGSFFNVMGLPTHRVYQELMNF